MTANIVFKGHFPGQPVVPGVCMMYIVKDLLEQEFAAPILLQTASQVKFLQLITPETQPVMVNIHWMKEAGKIAVTANFKSEKDLFKMNAVFAER